MNNTCFIWSCQTRGQENTHASGEPHEPDPIQNLLVLDGSFALTHCDYAMNKFLWCDWMQNPPYCGTVPAPTRTFVSGMPTTEHDNKSSIRRKHTMRFKSPAGNRVLPNCILLNGQFSTPDRNIAYKNYATSQNLYVEWDSENETIVLPQNLVLLSGQTIVPLVIVFLLEIMRLCGVPSLNLREERK